MIGFLLFQMVSKLKFKLSEKKETLQMMSNSPSTASLSHDFEPPTPKNINRSLIYTSN